MADKEIMETTKDTGRQIRPLYSIVENKGEVTLTIEMPGVKKQDLAISIENSELRVAGKRSGNDPNGRYLVRERRQGDFVKCLDHFNLLQTARN